MTTQPILAWRRSTAMTWRCCAGSSPAVGSSTTSRLGRVISSIARAAHRRTSGASLRIRVVRCGVRSSSSSTWPTTRSRCSAEASGGSRTSAAYCTACSTVSWRCSRSSRATIPMRLRMACSSACTSCPSTVARPELGALVPASTASSAELRAAEGPMTAVMVPGRAPNEMSDRICRPSTARPSWYAVTPVVRAAVRSGRRKVELASSLRMEGRWARSFEVITRSIRPGPFGCSAGATGGCVGATGG